MYWHGPRLQRRTGALAVDEPAQQVILEPRADARCLRPTAGQVSYSESGLQTRPLLRAEGRRGKVRIAAAALPVIADALSLEIEALIGTPARRRPAGGKRGPKPRIQQQLEQLSKLPKAKQRAVEQILESVLSRLTGTAGALTKRSASAGRGECFATEYLRG